MNLGGNTVLVTGGATGIGLAIAERFLKAGSDVIICGRRQNALEAARARHPALRTVVCDIALESERVRLFETVARDYPGLSVLVNNAGVQRRIQLAHPEPWAAIREEIAINLEAPIHLVSLFLPHLLKASSPAIINVSSGLAFSPLAGVPIYCATKAALRSFTLSLRHQLSQGPVRVVEIIPPAVNTDLGGPGLHDFGAPLDEFADAVMKRVGEGELEVAYGFSEKASKASRTDLDQMFAQMNPPPAAS